jgi:hypothetical protein
MHTLHTTNKPHETTNHNLQSPDEQQELSHMGVHSSTPAGSMTEMYKYKHKLKISAYDKTRGTKNERFIIVLFISLHSCAMQSVRCLLNKEINKKVKQREQQCGTRQKGTKCRKSNSDLILVKAMSKPIKNMVTKHRVVYVRYSLCHCSALPLDITSFEEYLALNKSIISIQCVNQKYAFDHTQGPLKSNLIFYREHYS